MTGLLFLQIVAKVAKGRESPEIIGIGDKKLKIAMPDAFRQVSQVGNVELSYGRQN